MPENIKPLTEVHKIGLSDPDQYNAGTAILKFTLDRNVDDANIYHSKDGVNWENLSGDVDGNTTSIKINGFSYFLAATPGGARDSLLYCVVTIPQIPEMFVFFRPLRPTTPVNIQLPG